MRLPRLFLAAGASCLLAAGLGGCAPDFHARLAKPASVASAPASDGAPPAEAAQTWPVETCVQILEKTADAPGRPASSRPAERDARRLATERLLVLYGAQLLAAPDHTLRVPVGPVGSVRLSLRRGGGPGGVEPSRFVSLEPADRFTVTGVPGFNRTPGEGAPLVGSLQPTPPVSSSAPADVKPVTGLVLTVTAVPVLASPPRRGRGASPLSLDLYDPHTTGRTAGAGRASQPLAADYTTPQAVIVTRLAPQHRGQLGLFRGSEYFASTGIFTTEQSTPDKIPLVLVHGLLSDPSDFHVLQASLEADPEVRRHYQVWVFYYPSSLPVAYAAMLLREDLEKFIHQLDPAGTHPALHRAVLVGHSMGGVLCRLAISDGGDRFYHHFFRQGLADLRLTAGQRALVRRAFYYRACPDVAQVVFIATPHHGSRLVSGLLGNLGRLLTHVPGTVRTRIADIFANNRGALAGGLSLKPGSSLDSLSPRGPLISALNEMPMRPGVGLHSILGDQGRAGPPERSSDGVVPYASAHLPEAASERLVPAGHTGTLKRPETADEIRRILDETGGDSRDTRR